MFRQTVKTQIWLLLEQFDLGLHCLNRLAACFSGFYCKTDSWHGNAILPKLMHNLMIWGTKVWNYQINSNYMDGVKLTELCFSGHVTILELWHWHWPKLLIGSARNMLLPGEIKKWEEEVAIRWFQHTKSCVSHVTSVCQRWVLDVISWNIGHLANGGWPVWKVWSWPLEMVDIICKHGKYFKAYDYKAINSYEGKNFNDI